MNPDPSQIKALVLHFKERHPFSNAKDDWIHDDIFRLLNGGANIGQVWNAIDRLPKNSPPRDIVKRLKGTGTMEDRVVDTSPLSEEQWQEVGELELKVFKKEGLTIEAFRLHDDLRRRAKHNDCERWGKISFQAMKASNVFWDNYRKLRDNPEKKADEIPF